MIPGCISGQYTKEQAQISLDALADWASVCFHQIKMVDIDADAQRILLENGEWIEYDVLSLDIGSTSRGLDTPGVSTFAIPTRPIDLLVDRVQSKLESNGSSKGSSERIHEEEMVQIVVVGGGAAGIELAMGLSNRFDAAVKEDIRQLQVTLLVSGNELLAHESEACQHALENVLDELKIRVEYGCRVQSMNADDLHLDDGRKMAYTHCIWAAGASAHSLSTQIRNAGISVNREGWVEVGPSLQSISHNNVFAAGDCATIVGLKDLESSDEKSSPPKAGVYAVRSGPVLIENISRYLKEQEMVPFDPQDDFLKLINCGDGTALGFRFGLPLRGKWVWELKDEIDQGFMNLFREEYLPDLSKEGGGGELDARTAQYDEYVRDPLRLNAEEACTLIMRRDDNVDFQQAWGVLREMMSDEDYKNEVLSFAEIRLH